MKNNSIQGSGATGTIIVILIVLIVLSGLAIFYFVDKNSFFETREPSVVINDLAETPTPTVTETEALEKEFEAIQVEFPESDFEALETNASSL